MKGRIQEHSKAADFVVSTDPDPDADCCFASFCHLGEDPAASCHTVAASCHTAATSCFATATVRAAATTMPLQSHLFSSFQMIPFLTSLWHLAYRSPSFLEV